jgi:hypothetical protein
MKSNDMIWYDDMKWYDTVWCDMIWCDVIWYEMKWWFEMECYEVVWWYDVCKRIYIYTYRSWQKTHVHMCQ